MGTVVILLGAPGAGKGTQAVRVSKAMGLPHISTGDLFRENLAQQTELGKRIKGFLDAGQLVPDETVIDVLFDRVGQEDCASGYLLDGFPRTAAQAEILTERVPSDWQTLVVSLDVPEASIVERAAGRLVCRDGGHVQHRTFSPPKVEGVCDTCGGELYTRDDDKPEVVRERLKVYAEQTKPVLDYYESRSLLQTIDGSGSPDQVFEALQQRLGAGA